MPFDISVINQICNNCNLVKSVFWANLFPFKFLPTGKLRKNLNDVVLAAELFGLVHGGIRASVSAADYNNLDCLLTLFPQVFETLDGLPEPIMIEGQPLIFPPLIVPNISGAVRFVNVEKNRGDENSHLL